MGRLIELDAAIAETWKDTGYSDPLNVMTALRDRLEALPTVDAIPIEWINLFNSTPIGGDSIDDLLREWRYKQEVEAERKETRTEMKLINADTVVHWQSYDDEHETFPDHEGTIAEFLDAMTDEGCPKTVDAVPVVQCKDCKHWRDSDGVYRRGVGAKSKCPINLAAVYKGTFYCGFGERKDGDRHDSK